MTKTTSFSLKNRKNRPVLRARLPDPVSLRRLGATPPDSYIYSISIRIIRCALNSKRRFHVTKEIANSSGLQ